MHVYVCPRFAADLRQSASASCVIFIPISMYGRVIFTFLRPLFFLL